MPGILPKEFSDEQKVCQEGMQHTVCLNSDKKTGKRQIAHIKYTGKKKIPSEFESPSVVLKPTIKAKEPRPSVTAIEVLFDLNGILF